jgi:hypothetical protein
MQLSGRGVRLLPARFAFVALGRGTHAASSLVAVPTRWNRVRNCIVLLACALASMATSPPRPVPRTPTLVADAPQPGRCTTVVVRKVTCTQTQVSVHVHALHNAALPKCRVALVANLATTATEQNFITKVASPAILDNSGSVDVVLVFDTGNLPEAQRLPQGYVDITERPEDDEQAPLTHAKVRFAGCPGE